LHCCQVVQIACRWGSSGGVDARLQGTYEHPSTGIAIRWHTNSVIPIAKGAKTCKNINTSIRRRTNSVMPIAKGAKTCKDINKHQSTLHYTARHTIFGQKQIMATTYQ